MHRPQSVVTDGFGLFLGGWSCGYLGDSRGDRRLNYRASERGAHAPAPVPNNSLHIMARERNRSASRLSISPRCYNGSAASGSSRSDERFCLPHPLGRTDFVVLVAARSRSGIGDDGPITISLILSRATGRERRWVSGRVAGAEIANRRRPSICNPGAENPPCDPHRPVRFPRKVVGSLKITRFAGRPMYLMKLSPP